MAGAGPIDFSLVTALEKNSKKSLTIFKTFIVIDDKDDWPQSETLEGQSSTTMKVLKGMDWATRHYKFKYLVRIGDGKRNIRAKDDCCESIYRDV